MGQNDRSALKKRLQEKRAKLRTGSVPGELNVEDFTEHPFLMQLFQDSATVGSDVKVGRVSFFTQEGRLTACLTMPSERMVAFTTLEGFQDAFTRLEAALAEDKLEWKPERTTAKRS